MNTARMCARTLKITKNDGAASSADIFAKARPDGYTLVLTELSPAVNPSKKLLYEAMRDFAPISVLVARPHLSVSAKTVRQESSRSSGNHHAMASCRLFYANRRRDYRGESYTDRIDRRFGPSSPQQASGGGTQLYRRTERLSRELARASRGKR